VNKFPADWRDGLTLPGAMTTPADSLALINDYRAEGAWTIKRIASRATRCESYASYLAELDKLIEFSGYSLEEVLAA
jgi:hypothetical protein